MRSVVWILLIGFLASCQGLPDDHALYGWFGDSAHRLQNIVRAPGNEIADSTRRLQTLPGKVSRFAVSEVHRATPLTASAVRFFDHEMAKTTSLPQNLTRAGKSGFDRATRNLASLSDPDTLFLTPNGWRANLTYRMNALSHPIEALDLNRPILSHHTDEDRITTIDSAPRKPSIVERILYRFRL